jgi:hypothetical protein
MINTHAISNARIALDTTVARLNIERFCKKFTGEANEIKRRTLLHLIAEEKTKLAALIVPHAINDFERVVAGQATYTNV